MVRVDYGFNGYRMPPVPRAARSAQRRGCLLKRKADDKQVCAFDLLAPVAAKEPDTLLENAHDGKPDCHERNFLITEVMPDTPRPNSCVNELEISSPEDVISRPISGVTSDGSGEELVNEDCKLRLGISSPRKDFELHCLVPSPSRLEKEKDRHRKLPAAFVSSVDRVEFPFADDESPRYSSPVSRDSVNLRLSVFR